MLAVPSQAQPMKMRTTSRVERARLLLMAENYKVQLGLAIAARRNELGMTQKDLADATHYKEAQSVSRWERGETVPGDLDVVAAALQWTVAELVAGIEPPNRKVARQLGMVAGEEGTPDLIRTFEPPDRLARIERMLGQILEAMGIEEQTDEELQRAMVRGLSEAAERDAAPGATAGEAVSRPPRRAGRKGR